MGTPGFMPGLFSQVAKFARSPQGRRLTQQAMRAAKDPATRKRLDDARRKVMSRGRPA